MHVKASMRPIDTAALSEHELRRCRAVARGRPWQAWEEQILWWSEDKVGWQPLQGNLVPNQRRWLLVETEEGLAVALIWDVTDGFDLPHARDHAQPLGEREPV